MTACPAAWHGGWSRGATRFDVLQSLQVPWCQPAQHVSFIDGRGSQQGLLMCVNQDSYSQFQPQHPYLYPEDTPKILGVSREGYHILPSLGHLSYLIYGALTRWREVREAVLHELQLRPTYWDSGKMKSPELPQLSGILSPCRGECSLCSPATGRFSL